MSWEIWRPPCRWLEARNIPPHQKVRVVSYVKRPRLRELLTWGLPWPSSSDSLAGNPLVGNPLSALIELLTPLLSEEALFLMPWILRIK